MAIICNSLRQANSLDMYVFYKFSWNHVLVIINVIVVHKN